MKREKLVQHINEKKSLLCVGLDSDIQKIPTHLLDYEDPIFEFNKIIIDNTQDLAIAYKPNIAFYESLGSKGWDSLKRTVDYIPDNIFKIADAKRGDIGNTASLYAKTFFKTLNFDAVTVSPYMGEDSVSPFLAFEDKWVILLAYTSNPGSQDFQNQTLKSGTKLYEEVLIKSQTYSDSDRLMYVVGATHPEELRKIRKLVPEAFFLVPGIGAQGGSLTEVIENGKTKEHGLLINSSRGIIYSSSDKDFGKNARKEAQKLVIQMEPYFT